MGVEQQRDEVEQAFSAIQQRLRLRRRSLAVRGKGGGVPARSKSQTQASKWGHCCRSRGSSIRLHGLVAWPLLTSSAAWNVARCVCRLAMARTSPSTPAHASRSAKRSASNSWTDRYGRKRASEMSCAKLFSRCSAFCLNRLAPSPVGADEDVQLGERQVEASRWTCSQRPRSGRAMPCRPGPCTPDPAFWSSERPSAGLAVLESPCANVVQGAHHGHQPRGRLRPPCFRS